jgi:membrane protein DedA with SNARE-associated domain
MRFLEQIIGFLASWIVAVIAAGGYGGIVLLMAIESACIPLPSEIIMPFAGYLVSTGQMNLFAVATAGAIGCNVGSIIAYEVGKHGGPAFVERWGRYVLLDIKDLHRAERFFARWGSATVLICRLLPVVRSFIAFPAGVARMPLGRFHLYTFVGSWPWCFGLAWVGKLLGEQWRTDPRLSQLLHRLDVIVISAVVLGGLWFLQRKAFGAKEP